MRARWPRKAASGPSVGEAEGVWDFRMDSWTGSGRYVSPASWAIQLLTEKL